MSLKKAFDQSITPKFQVSVRPPVSEPIPEAPKIWISKNKKVFKWIGLKYQWIMSITFPVCWKELADSLQLHIEEEVGLESVVGEADSSQKFCMEVLLPSEILQDCFYDEMKDWLMEEGDKLGFWEKSSFHEYGEFKSFTDRVVSGEDPWNYFSAPVEGEWEGSHMFW